MTYFSDAKLLITMIFRYLQMQIFVNEAKTLFKLRLLILQYCYIAEFFYSPSRFFNFKMCFISIQSDSHSLKIIESSFII